MCRIPPRVPRLYMVAEEPVRVGSDEAKSSARQAS